MVENYSNTWHKPGIVTGVDTNRPVSYRKARWWDCSNGKEVNDMKTTQLTARGNPTPDEGPDNTYL